MKERSQEKSYRLRILPKGVVVKHATSDPRDTYPGPGEVWWSGAGEPPAIGSRVNVRMNGFGMATVRWYFIEYGWLGVEVECDVRPAWHVKQCKDPDRIYPMVFGAELKEA